MHATTRKIALHLKGLIIIIIITLDIIHTVSNLKKSMTTFEKILFVNNLK